MKESDKSSYEVYDSLGITVSMSHDPAWSAESGWTVSTALLVVIGSRDGGGANARFTVPADAEISVEHERDDDKGELEFQLVWKPTD